MVINEMRHDSNNLIQNEHLAITLDTFHDRRNGFLLPRQRARRHARGERSSTSATRAATGTRCGTPRRRASTSGWTVEMAIPFKSLRYRARRGHDLGHPVEPHHPVEERADVAVAAAAVARHARRSAVSQAATLVGLETPPLSQEPRDQAVRDRRAHHRSHGAAGADRQRRRRRRRRRREVRPDRAA